MRFTCVLFLTLITLGCGYGSHYNGGIMGGPVPSIIGLAPMSATAGGPGFPLTINGNNLSVNSVVYWNMTPRTTTYTNTNQISVMITAADIANPGANSLYVRSNGQNSNTMTFTVN